MNEHIQKLLTLEQEILKIQFLINKIMKSSNRIEQIISEYESKLDAKRTDRTGDSGTKNPDTPTSN